VVVARRPLKRADDITSKLDEDDLLDLYKDVCKGFEEQRDRADEIADNWDMYNCRLSDRQFYNGTSQIATPFVQDAVEARVTRFTNQLFPQSGRFVEVTTNGEDPPQAIQSLLEMYVRKCKFRTDVIPELLRNGDVEGQWNVYVSWDENTRYVTGKVTKQPKMAGGAENPAAEPVEDIDHEEVVDSLPDIEVLSDPDVLILPAACKNSVHAINTGGSVTVIRRWSKAKIKKAMREGDIKKDAGEALIESMSSPKTGQDGKDIAKEQLDAAGIRERGKVALIYELWKKFEVEGERRLCRVYFGVPDIVLGAKLNPFWNDRCPLISAALKKKTGSSKGRAPVCSVTDLWVLSNDTINEGADTAHFSAMPIVMTDPLENPRVDTMVLGLASVWEVKPSSTEIVTFPELWQNALTRALAIKDQIFQTLGVNPSMIPMTTGRPTAKRNQAELAIEQQVDILTTADVVGNFEESIATPMIQMIAEHDQQFRDDAITVQVYGELGLQVLNEEVPPLQLGNRYEYRWFGVESARNAAQMQQQISGLNVFKEIPPNLYQGYKLNMAPLLVRVAEHLFGPRVGPRIFEKVKEISTDPWIENELLLHGFDVELAPSDDDMEHIQVHMHVVESHADTHGKAQAHIVKHQAQMQAKMVAQMQQMQPGGGGGAGPKPGGQVTQPRQGKGPPGGIPPDQMARAGAVGMPRKT
jgi:hypothetical protein